MPQIINPFVHSSKLDNLKVGDTITDGGSYTDVIVKIETLSSTKGKLYSITTKSGIVFSLNKYLDQNTATGD